MATPRPAAPASRIIGVKVHRLISVASTSSLDTVVLRAGDSSLTLIPALGGKIASLRLSGREWLWTSDLIPRRVPDDSMRADTASYVEMADTGGYDECFPTVAACTLPPGVPEFGGLHLPDHGELWSQQPTIDVDRDADGEHAIVTWTGRRMPYRFVRTSRLGHDGWVTMRYVATNTGRVRMPFLWSAHPLLPLTDHTRVYLPAGARLRVDASHGLAVRRTSDHAWPMLLLDGAAVDLSHPAAVGDGGACKLFLDLPAGPVQAAVEEGGRRLELALDGSAIPHFGLWINNRGWTPFAGGRPYRNMAFEPCIGAPDSLANALGTWNAAAWLEPGETRRWSLVWSAGRG